MVELFVQDASKSHLHPFLVFDAGVLLGKGVGLERRPVRLACGSLRLTLADEQSVFQNVGDFSYASVDRHNQSCYPTGLLAGQKEDRCLD